MTSPLRVLLVSHYFPPHLGGIENVVAAQARHLARAGHDVTVLTTSPGARAGTERADGYTVVRVRTWNGIERRSGVPFPVVAPWAAVPAARLVRRADVVHVHDLLYPTTWLAALLATLTVTPLVLTQHVGLVAHPSRVVEAVQRLVHATVGRAVVARARAITHLNGRVATFLVGLGADRTRLHFLANGTDTDQFRPADTAEARRALRAAFGLPATGVLALFAGRFVPKKGYDIVLAATGPDHTLVLAGGPVPPGPPPPGAVVLGPQTPEQMADLYRACDLFVLPSEAEGFPLTAQEAMASGLPVILTDDPGYRDYALDRDRVTFVDRSVAAVSAALTRLAADAPLRARMAAYSRRRAELRFSWPEHVGALTAVYRRAVEEQA